MPSWRWTRENHNYLSITVNSIVIRRSREQGGAVVRALAFHQRVPGSIPGPGVICGLSLLLVLYSASRGFSPGTPVFPSPKKTNIWYDLFDLQSPQLVEHSCSARMIWDLNKVIIIITTETGDTASAGLMSHVAYMQTLPLPFYLTLPF